MKKILFALLPVAAVAFMALKPAIDPLPLGAAIPSPDVKMQDISGQDVSLNDVKTEKGLLVMFSCNTCPYVIKNQPRTYEVSKYATGMGVGVALLNSNEAKRGDDDSFDEMKKYAAAQSYHWKYLVDKNHKVADAFGANRTPECFLFDANGKLVYHGAIDDNPSDANAVTRKHLLVAIDEMLAGKDIKVKESRSVGCTIKRL
ncbi:MAG: thioredoxin family protein [Chitinophagaceae bacterium]|nr:thioredoxin family protein [Chitinophagaceae bacterium]